MLLCVGDHGKYVCGCCGVVGWGVCFLCGGRKLFLLAKFFILPPSISRGKDNAVLDMTI